jgi:hypothetical protein
MKKSGIILAAAAAAASPAAAFGQTPGGFEIGAEAFDYNYRERDEGDTIVFDDGRFGGFHAGYLETIGGGWLLRARLAVAFGSVDYRAPDPASEVRLDNVRQSIGQLEFHIGRDFPVGGGATVTPFAGLASRILNDNSGGREAEDGTLGYDREISYAYVPLGLGARVPLSGRTSLVFSGQYNLFVGGDAKSKFSKVDAELPDVNLELESGHGIEASAAIETRIGGAAVRFGPFLRQWKIRQSETFTITNPDDPTESLEFTEPPNRTTELGLRLSLAF